MHKDIQLPNISRDYIQSVILMEESNLTILIFPNMQKNTWKKENRFLNPINKFEIIRKVSMEIFENL